MEVPVKGVFEPRTTHNPHRFVLNAKDRSPTRPPFSFQFNSQSPAICGFTLSLFQTNSMVVKSEKSSKLFSRKMD